ncbi:hypothetical protein SAMN02745121_02499 [Nannocystis exedens]|uniref:Tetratricopeptide repeat-containing protein n=1 Tax=Nannocystis exedens TaxID=54 RepID=A0A1I1WSG9_9BACT|nr:tetratricopeptide repeat protein [Nannocystis exedens]PCC71030.1 hypothetical protein NAEX_04099 [Nannocystis exedens]SFD98107.1 hypothetical protein SAMN02745121_02499 [Nannocystis exedens]
MLLRRRELAEHGLEPGDLAGSERHDLEALKVIELRHEPDHLGAAMVQQNYAVLLRRLGRTQEALALVSRVRARLAARIGESHIYLADLDTAVAGLDGAERA